jgi:hypothetical protein
MILFDILLGAGFVLVSVFILMMLPAALWWLICKLFGDTSG